MVNDDAPFPTQPRPADQILAELYSRLQSVSSDETARSTFAELESEIALTPLDQLSRASALYSLSAQQINVGGDIPDESLVSTGIALAEALIQDGSTHPLLLPQLLQNVANAESVLFHLRARQAAGGDTPLVIDSALRFDADSLIVSARRKWNTVANTPLLPEIRARALCNLANELDNAGRWVEAYAAYAEACDIDPENGNAAGNRAQLLLWRIRNSHDQLGHLQAVYEKWARRAKELRAQTVEIAGERAAQLWDDLPLSDEPVLGHLSHTGDLGDPYQRWIVRHRLALVATVEGLGTDDNRWDTADIAAAQIDNDEGRVPRIFAAMNVLKAEFIVARRLAFRGEELTFTDDGHQHPADTGAYGETNDGAVYGEGPATMLLAQRSALDLLDKIAVTANEHFRSGLMPAKVDFTTYWRDVKTGELRPEVATLNGRRARLALAELQRDLSPNALYPTARLLRNAGTHRLVHGTVDLPSGPTRETFSTVDLLDLQEATLEALWVARAGFLYLVDLIDAETPALDPDAVAGVRSQV